MDTKSRSGPVIGSTLHERISPPAADHIGCVQKPAHAPSAKGTGPATFAHDMAPADIQQNVHRLFSEYLEHGGHRKTPERFAILREIYAVDGHFDIELLYGRMQQTKCQVSRATLYNTMDLLLDARLVRKHQFGTTQAQFEKAQIRGQHDHVICDGCGKVQEFCDPRIQNVRNTVSEVLGFRVSHHALHIHGICADCQKKSNERTKAARAAVQP